MNATRLAPPTAGLRVALALGVVFLAVAVGFAIGTTAATDDPPARDSVDVGFLDDMISHHEQALQMSNVELQNGAEPSIQVFAREILLSQSYEVGAMQRQVEQWGYTLDDRTATAMAWMGEPTPVDEMPGLASGAEMDLLAERRGRDADALFVVLMQDHHRGGAHMAAYAAANAVSPFVRDIAERMERNQRNEIRELEHARARAGLAAAPPGYSAAVMPHERHGR